MYQKSVLYLFKLFIILILWFKYSFNTIHYFFVKSHVNVQISHSLYSWPLQIPILFNNANFIIHTLTLWMLLWVFMLTSCPCGRSFYCSLETLKHHGKLDNCHIQNTHVIKWVMRNSDTCVPFFGYTEIPKCLNVSYFNL